MFSSDKNIETIAQLVEQLKQYGGLRLEMLKLDATEKTVKIISALILGLTTSHSSADTASSDDITLKLDVACTVSSVVTSPHSALDMNVGQYKTDIGNTDISVFCNDNNGYSVYAIGNSNSTDGNSDLISNINENYNIHTGTNTTGNSSWAMKLTAGTGTSSETTPPNIVNGYNNYSLIDKYIPIQIMKFVTRNDSFPRGKQVMIDGAVAFNACLTNIQVPIP